MSFRRHNGVRLYSCQLSVACWESSSIAPIATSNCVRGRRCQGGTENPGELQTVARLYWKSPYTAFRVGLADVIAAPNALRSAGITPLDFDGKPTDLPVVLAWMPAAAVYFRDPDGHLLEYIAMLPHAPRPDCGVVPWRMWKAMNDETPVLRVAATPL